MCSEIENVIMSTPLDLASRVPLNLALSPYLKTVNSNKANLPVKIKKENVFFVSIFYKGKLVRENVVSSSPKEKDQVFPEKESDFISKAYKQFEDKDNSSDACSFSEKVTQKEGEIFILRIGYVCVVVKNHQLSAARLFAYIVAAFITKMKAWMENTEIGTSKDLLDLALQHGHEAGSYLKRSLMIESSQIGGHR